jgi:hypothetical protein
LPDSWKKQTHGLIRSPKLYDEFHPRKTCPQPKREAVAEPTINIRYGTNKEDRRSQRLRNGGKADNITGEEMFMKLRLLLFILYQKLKKAAQKDSAYRSFLGFMKVKIMIKTADGKHGRLFIFDRGKLSTLAGGMHNYDAALIWSDPNTAFKVLSSGSDELTFLAAAKGDLKIDGMAAYVQWFTDGVKLVMK